MRDFRELREAKGMPQDNTNDDIAACDNTNAETNVDGGDGWPDSVCIKKIFDAALQLALPFSSANF